MNINYDQELRLEIRRILPKLGYNVDSMPAHRRIPTTVSWANGLYEWVTKYQEPTVVEADPEVTPVEETPAEEDCCGCGGCYEPNEETDIVDNTILNNTVSMIDDCFTKSPKKQPTSKALRRGTLSQLTSFLHEGRSMTCICL